MDNSEQQTKLEKIYSKFEEMKKEAVEDCKFDKNKMDTAFNITNKVVKWINLKSEWSKVFRTLETNRKNAWRKRYEYYQTEYALKLSTKEEYTLFIESDPLYVDYMNLSLTVKEIIQYIDSVLDALKQKGYEVKNFIDYNKFINGA